MLARMHQRPLRPLPLFALALLAALAGTAASGLAEESVDNPAVVELYTSQGCASCPPADELLGELARRADVVALSLHVDYWDYIGWRDPFAKRRFTERQQAYIRRMHGRFVYTPQIVVDGRWEAVGSRRDEVMDAIARARTRAKAIVPRMERRGDTMRIVIPAGEAPAPATVWLALYDRKHVTRVPRGENAGRELANYNVVRELRSLATWTGKRIEMSLDPEAMGAARFDGCAVLVQRRDTGPILGAAAVALAEPARR